jgi:hypothetical protein
MKWSRAEELGMRVEVRTAAAHETGKPDARRIRRLRARRPAQQAAE